MDISTEIVAAIAGAAAGSVVTGIVSYALHRQSLAQERKLARQKVDWDFLATTLPVLSRFFSSTTPDRVTSENDVFVLTDDVYASLREGTFRGIFAGSSNTQPIAGNVSAYTEALNRYVRREISRAELEVHRKRALDEVSVHWKTILPQA